MNGKYILDGKVAVPTNDLMEWAAWMETNSRRVARTETATGYVSTVFLGLDHSFGEGKVLLFETMVFGDVLNEEMDRYETWDEAEAGHERMVARVNKREQETS